MGKSLLKISLLISICYSCTKEIDIDYPEMPKQLNLNSVLTAGQSVTASLSSTLPFGEGGLSPSYKNGLITLIENGVLIDTLKICGATFRPSANDTAWTYCSNHIVKQENEYELRAYVNGFPEVSGKTYIPKKAIVHKILSEEDGDEGVPFEIQMEDPDADENFYILEMRYEAFGVDSTIGYLSTTDPTLNLYSSAQLGVPQFRNNRSDANKMFFTDKYFDGNIKKLVLRVDFDYGVEANKLVLRSVSKQHYEYYRNLEINKGVANNPFSEPLRVKSNVTNGFGLVGGVNETVVRF